MLIAAAMGGDRLDLTGFEDRVYSRGTKKKSCCSPTCMCSARWTLVTKARGSKAGIRRKYGVIRKLQLVGEGALALVELSLLPIGQH